MATRKGLRCDVKQNLIRPHPRPSGPDSHTELVLLVRNSPAPEEILCLLVKVKVLHQQPGRNFQTDDSYGSNRNVSMFISKNSAWSHQREAGF